MTTEIPFKELMMYDHLTYTFTRQEEDVMRQTEQSFDAHLLAMEDRFAERMRLAEEHFESCMQAVARRFGRACMRAMQGDVDEVYMQAMEARFEACTKAMEARYEASMKTMEEHFETCMKTMEDRFDDACMQAAEECL